MTDLTQRNWVIGNWKLNPVFDQAQILFEQIAKQFNQLEQYCNIAIAPPMPYLAYFSLQNQQLPIIAQDISTVSGMGAFTGEVSAELLKSIHIDYVLIGHSERREIFADDVQKIQQKIQNALRVGLTIVYCVGESLLQREAGNAEAVVLQQLQDLQSSLSGVDDWHKIIIAYEPIWAIGTGKTASPQDAQEMHATIRAYLKQQTTSANSIPLLYGGSVKPENAVELAACADINGALVGGASLDASSFIAIIQAFAQNN